MDIHLVNKTAKMKRNTLLMTLIIPLALSAQNIDTSALRQLITRSRETKSDALIIMKDGKNLLYEIKGKTEKPIYIASAGKSLVALGIMKLLDLKLIDSLQQPVYTLYPEWKQGTKKNITIEMLLNHTSGLQNHQNASIELEPPPNSKVKNVINIALAAELSTVPGTVSNYNNKAVALLGGIIEKASGKRMDVFFEEYFFAPMNITGYDWIKDEEGNPTAHGAFILKPGDLAKFGMLVLDNGIYKGKTILSKGSIDLCLKQSFEKEPLFGLLWWRMPKSQTRVIDDEILKEWKAAGIQDSVVSKLRPMFNKPYSTRDAFFADWLKILGNNWPILFDKAPRISNRIFSEEIVAYYASGSFGNFLVVVPKLNLIAVRNAAYRSDFDFAKDGFEDFPTMVSKLLLE
jgi:CubicO group peptidase (beta-lactamase class C family)